MATSWGMALRGAASGGRPHQRLPSRQLQPSSCRTARARYTAPAGRNDITAIPGRRRRRAAEPPAPVPIISAPALPAPPVPAEPPQPLAASIRLVRFGIVILPDLRWKQAERRWRLAEEYGFDHAWTYDHLGWRDLVDGPWFDAVPTLTAAAMVTSRISLGTLVASPNFRHPVSFARQLTALDDVSNGRLILGVGAGAGGTSFDIAVLGGPPLTVRERADRFAEFTE